jgi:hypothetical protein
MEEKYSSALLIRSDLEALSLVHSCLETCDLFLKAAARPVTIAPHRIWHTIEVRIHRATGSAANVEIFRLRLPRKP